MATIAAIHSKLTLNTRDFRTGLDKARQRVGDFTDKARASTNAVGKYGAAMGAAALAGGALLVRQQLKAIDADAKFADQIGISTQALAGYRHSANLAGVEQSVLDKGLQRLTRTLGQAQAGEAAAVKGLATLGLSAADLEGKLPEEALGIIADRIKEQPDAASRAAAAYAVFGRSGQDMLTFLNQGSEGLADTAAEADALGLSLTRVDAAKVEMANDAMARVQAIGQGAAQSLTVALAPTIEAVANKLLEAGTSGRSMGDRVTDGTEFAATAVAILADIVGVLPLGFKGAQLAVVSLGKFAVDSLGGIHDMATELLGGILREAAKVAAAIPGIGDDIADGLNAVADGIEFTSDFREALSDELGRTQTDLQEQFDAMLIAPSYGEQVTQFFDEVRAEAEANAQAIADAGNAAGEAAGDTAALFDQLEADAANAQKVEETLNGLQQELDRLGMSDPDIKLADLAQLGATNEQLAEAERRMQELAAAEQRETNRQDFAQTIADLEKEIATTGLDDRALFRFDLETQGFDREQIDQALAKYDELEQKKKTLNSTDEEAAPITRIDAGSAEAQRLAFQARRGIQQPIGPRIDIDDSPLRDVETRLAQLDAPPIGITFDPDPARVLDDLAAPELTLYVTPTIAPAPGIPAIEPPTIQPPETRSITERIAGIRPPAIDAPHIGTPSVPAIAAPEPVATSITLDTSGIDAPHIDPPRPPTIDLPEAFATRITIDTGGIDAITDRLERGQVWNITPRIDPAPIREAMSLVPPDGTIAIERSITPPPTEAIRPELSVSTPAIELRPQVDAASTLAPAIDRLAGYFAFFDPPAPRERQTEADRITAAGHRGGPQDTDDTPRRQLEEQRHTNRLLGQIAAKQTARDGEGWEL